MATEPYLVWKVPNHTKSYLTDAKNIRMQSEFDLIWLFFFFTIQLI